MRGSKSDSWLSSRDSKTWDSGKKPLDNLYGFLLRQIRRKKAAERRLKGCSEGRQINCPGILLECSTTCSSRAQGGWCKMGIRVLPRNFMHLALVWWTTALASNTRAEKRLPLVIHSLGFKPFFTFKGWKCSDLPGATACRIVLKFAAPACQTTG